MAVVGLLIWSEPIECVLGIRVPGAATSEGVEQVANWFRLMSCYLVLNSSRKFVGRGAFPPAPPTILKPF